MMKSENYFTIKRFIDIVLAVVLIYVSLPILLLLMILIKNESRGASVFRDIRIGKNGKEFVLYKLRTMYENSPRGFVTDNDPRVTRIGKILRKSSLDEIPQFFNVFRGDMSFIGPRPDLVSNYRKYDDSIKRRLLLRPGITGWAQVNGRNQISWAERYIYDLEYIDKISFLFDLKIMYLTAKNIFLMKNINISC
jgi:lipopolysaccharide/colanic/teichoic acid biosynthesis glycosyltransferase